MANFNLTAKLTILDQVYGLAPVVKNINSALKDAANVEVKLGKVSQTSLRSFKTGLQSQLDGLKFTVGITPVLKNIGAFKTDFKAKIDKFKPKIMVGARVDVSSFRDIKKQISDAVDRFKPKVNIGFAINNASLSDTQEKAKSRIAKTKASIGVHLRLDNSATTKLRSEIKSRANFTHTIKTALSLDGRSVSSLRAQLKNQLKAQQLEIKLKINNADLANINKMTTGVKTLNDAMYALGGSTIRTTNLLKEFARTAKAISQAANQVVSATRKTQTVSTRAKGAKSKVDDSPLTSSLSAKTDSTPLVVANMSAMASAADKTISRFSRLKAEYAALTKEAHEFGKLSGVLLKRFLGFSLASSGVIALTASVKNGVEEAILYQREMVRLAQTTGETTHSLRDIDKEVSKLAKTYGVSSKELIVVAKDLAQAGKSAAEVKIALEAISQASLAPSFKDMNSIVETSIALMNQFDIKTRDLGAALSVINTIAAQTAVEAEDLSIAIQKAGAIFAISSKQGESSFQSFNKFLSLFAAVKDTTQESAETTANALKTIASRVQSFEFIDKMRELGVVLTETGERGEEKFIGVYEAVERLNAALFTTNKAGKIDLAGGINTTKILTELGGLREIGKAIPFIAQIDKARKNKQAADAQFAEATRTDANGNRVGKPSIAQDAEKAQEAVIIKLNRTKEAFFGLIRDLGKSTEIQNIAQQFLNAADKAIMLVDAVRPLLPMITALGGARLVLSAIGYAGGVASGFSTRNKLPNLISQNPGPRGLAKGGYVDAMVMPGELIFSPQDAKKNGLGKLRRFNEMGYADGIKGTPMRVPGVGNTDSVPMQLPVGSFVIKKKHAENPKKFADGDEAVRLYRGFGTDSDHESGLDWYAKDKKLAALYAESRRNGKVIEKDVPRSYLTNLLEIKNDRQRVSPSSFANYVANHSKANNIDERDVKEFIRFHENDTGHDKDRPVISYWSDKEKKLVLKRFLSKMNFKGIAMPESSFGSQIDTFALMDLDPKIPSRTILSGLNKTGLPGDLHLPKMPPVKSHYEELEELKREMYGYADGGVVQKFAHGDKAERGHNTFVKMSQAEMEKLQESLKKQNIDPSFKRLYRGVGTYSHDTGFDWYSEKKQVAEAYASAAKDGKIIQKDIPKKDLLHGIVSFSNDKSHMSAESFAEYIMNRSNIDTSDKEKYVKEFLSVHSLERKLDKRVPIFQLWDGKHNQIALKKFLSQLGLRGISISETFEDPRERSVESFGLIDVDPKIPSTILNGNRSPGNDLVPLSLIGRRFGPGPLLMNKFRYANGGIVQKLANGDLSERFSFHKTIPDNLREKMIARLASFHKTFTSAKMDVPLVRKITVGGIANDALDEIQASGSYSPRTQDIDIHSNRSQKGILSTLQHELIHNADFHLGLQNDRNNKFAIDSRLSNHLLAESHNALNSSLQGKIGNLQDIVFSNNNLSIDQSKYLSKPHEILAHTGQNMPLRKLPALFRGEISSEEASKYFEKTLSVLGYNIGRKKYAGGGPVGYSEDEFNQIRKAFAAAGIPLPRFAAMGGQHIPKRRKVKVDKFRMRLESELQAAGARSKNQQDILARYDKLINTVQLTPGEAYKHLTGQELFKYITKGRTPSDPRLPSSKEDIVGSGDPAYAQVRDQYGPRMPIEITRTGMRGQQITEQYTPDNGIRLQGGSSIKDIVGSSAAYKSAFASARRYLSTTNVSSKDIKNFDREFLLLAQQGVDPNQIHARLMRIAMGKSNRKPRQAKQQNFNAQIEAILATSSVINQARKNAQTDLGAVSPEQQIKNLATYYKNNDKLGVSPRSATSIYSNINELTSQGVGLGQAFQRSQFAQTLGQTYALPQDKAQETDAFFAKQIGQKRSYGAASSLATRRVELQGMLSQQQLTSSAKGQEMLAKKIVAEFDAEANRTGDADKAFLAAQNKMGSYATKMQGRIDPNVNTLPINDPRRNAAARPKYKDVIRQYLDSNSNNKNQLFDIDKGTFKRNVLQNIANGMDIESSVSEARRQSVIPHGSVKTTNIAQQQAVARKQTKQGGLSNEVAQTLFLNNPNISPQLKARIEQQQHDKQYKAAEAKALAMQHGLIQPAEYTKSGNRKVVGGELIGDKFVPSMAVSLNKEELRAKASELERQRIAQIKAGANPYNVTPSSSTNKTKASAQNKDFSAAQYKANASNIQGPLKVALGNVLKNVRLQIPNTTISPESMRGFVKSFTRAMNQGLTASQATQRATASLRFGNTINGGFVRQENSVDAKKTQIAELKKVANGEYLQMFNNNIKQANVFTKVFSEQIKAGATKVQAFSAGMTAVSQKTRQLGGLERVRLALGGEHRYTTKIRTAKEDILDGDGNVRYKKGEVIGGGNERRRSSGFGGTIGSKSIGGLAGRAIGAFGSNPLALMALGGTISSFSGDRSLTGGLFSGLASGAGVGAAVSGGNPFAIAGGAIVGGANGLLQADATKRRGEADDALIKSSKELTDNFLRLSEKLGNLSDKDFIDSNERSKIARADSIKAEQENSSSMWERWFGAGRSNFETRVNSLRWNGDLNYDYDMQTGAYKFNAPQEDIDRISGQFVKERADFGLKNLTGNEEIIARAFKQNKLNLVEDQIIQYIEAKNSASVRKVVDSLTKEGLVSEIDEKSPEYKKRLLALELGSVKDTFSNRQNTDYLMEQVNNRINAQIAAYNQSVIAVEAFARKIKSAADATTVFETDIERRLGNSSAQAAFINPLNDVRANPAATDKALGFLKSNLGDSPELQEFQDAVNLQQTLGSDQFRSLIEKLKKAESSIVFNKNDKDGTVDSLSNSTTSDLRRLLREDPEGQAFKNKDNERFIEIFTNMIRGKDFNSKDKANSRASIIDSAFEEASKVFGEKISIASRVLDDLVNNQQRYVSQMESLNKREIQAHTKRIEAQILAGQRSLEIAELSGRTLSPDQLAAPEEKIIRDLGGSLDPRRIADSIIEQRENLFRTNRQIDLAKPTAGTNESIISAAKLKELVESRGEQEKALARSEQALDMLAKSTIRLTGIQNELGRVEQRRQAQRNVLDKLTRASLPGGNAIELNKAVGAAFSLLAGNKRGLTAETFDSSKELLMTLAAAEGEDATKNIEQLIYKQQAALLAGAGAPKDLIDKLALGLSKRGESTPEKALIAAYQAASDKQVDAIKQQARIISEPITLLKTAIQDLSASIKNIPGVKGKTELPLADIDADAKRDGGFIRGSYKGNRDTELTKLVPGEFVVRRNVAQKNKGGLIAMNNGMDPIQAFADGGEVKAQINKKVQDFYDSFRKAGIQIPPLDDIGFDNDKLGNSNARYDNGKISLNNRSNTDDLLSTLQHELIHHADLSIGKRNNGVGYESENTKNPKLKEQIERLQKYADQIYPTQLNQKNRDYVKRPNELISHIGQYMPVDMLPDLLGGNLEDDIAKQYLDHTITMKLKDRDSRLSPQSSQLSGKVFNDSNIMKNPLDINNPIYREFPVVKNTNEGLLTVNSNARQIERAVQQNKLRKPNNIVTQKTDSIIRSTNDISPDIQALLDRNTAANNDILTASQNLLNKESVFVKPEPVNKNQELLAQIKQTREINEANAKANRILGTSFGPVGISKENQDILDKVRLNNSINKESVIGARKISKPSLPLNIDEMLTPLNELVVNNDRPIIGYGYNARKARGKAMAEARRKYFDGMTPEQHRRKRLSNKNKYSNGPYDPNKRRKLIDKIRGFNDGGTVDSVLAAVTPGEFVVKKEVAQQHKSFLNHLNKGGKVQKFANGGEVKTNSGGGFGYQTSSRKENNGGAIDTSSMKLLASALDKFDPSKLAGELSKLAERIEGFKDIKIVLEMAPIKMVHSGAVSVETSALQGKFDEMEKKIESMLNKHIDPLTGETRGT